MDLIFVANPSSVHTLRWVDGLTRRGHRVTVVPNNEYGLSGARKWIRLARNHLALRRQRRRQRGAVLIAMWVPGGVRALVLRGLHPLVAVPLGSDIYLADRATPRRALRMRLQSQLLAEADAVVCPSQDMADVLAARVPREIEVIPLGVDLAAFAPSPRAVRQGPVVFGYAKHLRSIYGPDVLLEAFARLRETDVELRIAGDGPMRPMLEAIVRQSGLAARVRFVGALDHASMPAFLRQLDVFVMPSRSESFGVAAVEAAATGLPTIASRVGGVPEVVDDGRTGLLVPPEDPVALAAAMARLAAEPETRRAMGREGRARADRLFDFERSLDRFEACLGRVTEVDAVRRL